MSSGTQHIQTEDLSAYIDGFVDQRLRSAIVAHVAICAECRAELAELRATVRLLNALPTLSPRRSFQLDPRHATARPARGTVLTLLPVVRALSVAAAIALLVVSGAFLFDSSESGNRVSHIAFSEMTSEPTADSGASGETNSTSRSSESAEDAEINQSAAATDQAGESQQQGALIDRGDAAAVGDGPMAELPGTDEPQPAQSAGAESADQAGPDTVAQDLPASSSATSRSTATAADERQIPWGTITLGVGAATIVLAGLWIALARISRSTIHRDP